MIDGIIVALAFLMLYPFVRKNFVMLGKDIKSLADTDEKL